MAQSGSVLDLGSSGRGFESRLPYQEVTRVPVAHHWAKLDGFPMRGPECPGDTSHGGCSSIGRVPDCGSGGGSSILLSHTTWFRSVTVARPALTRCEKVRFLPGLQLGGIMKLIDAYNAVASIGRIDEAGLSRLLSRIQGRDFAIATAFRGDYSKAENRKRNAELLQTLNQRRMGGYMLIGHWQEAPDGVDYNDADPGTLTDVVEESVLFVKPDGMSTEDFEAFCTGIARRYNQDAVIVGETTATTEGLHEVEGDYAIYLVFKDGSKDQIGSGLSLNKTAQAYSQMRNKPNVPFVFEGTLAPVNNIGRQAFKTKNIKYVI